MTEQTQLKLKDAIQDAKGLYNRLVLLVGESGSGKTANLRELACGLSVNIINISLTLSEKLLELTTKQRTLRLPDVLDQITKREQVIVILDNLEIMFDPDLKQDPLRLLQKISRDRLIVASWNGIIKEGKLIYAQQGHHEYRNYDLADILIVTMEEESLVESAKKTREAGQA